jgi:hypothetical protein
VSGTARGGAISLAEITRALLARHGSGSESVTLKQNAKGETQWEVVAVAQEGESLLAAQQRAELVYDSLAAKYGPVDTLLADLQASVKP